MSTQADIELKVTPRKPGKGNSRKLRQNKQIPAVVYGPKVENVSFQVFEGDAIRYSGHQHENTIFTLKCDDKRIDGIQVLKKTVAIHPVSRRPIHIDFFAPEMNKPVQVNMELNYVGEPIGVKDEGGNFNAVMREITVECLPNKIPESIEVDVSELRLHDSMHVSDVKIPEGLTLITAEDETIVSIQEPQPEIVPEEEGAAEGETEGAEEGAATSEGEEASESEENS